MNAEQRLYENLSSGKDTSIPLGKAVEYFIGVKLASGGLLAEEVDLLAKVAKGSFLPEDIIHAQEQGALSGVRSSASQDITHAAKLLRTKSERFGKGVGTGAGVLAGLLSGGVKPVDKALRAAAGAIIGREGGKLVGQKFDESRLIQPLKTAAAEKTAAMNPVALARLREALSAVDIETLRDTALSSGAQGGAENAMSDTLSAAGTMAGSAVRGKYKIPAMIMGGLAGKGAGGLAAREKSATQIDRVKAVLNKKAELNSPTAVMENEPMQDAYPAQDAPASRDVTGDALPAEPTLQPDQDLLPTPLDPILDMLQRGNEAEHYEQKAEDAQQVAEKAKADAELARGELEQIQKDQEIAVQQHAEELHAARTSAEAASAESQAIQQQLVAGQEQTQTAQMQATQLLQAMNSFRQGLIDYLVQDPTQAAVPGMMAPTPGSGQIMQDPSQMMSSPGATLAQPGAEQSGQPGAQPQAAPAEAQPSAPETSPAEPAVPKKKSEGGGDSEKKESKDGGSKKGVTVHVA